MHSSTFRAVTPIYLIVSCLFVVDLFADQNYPPDPPYLSRNIPPSMCIHPDPSFLTPVDDNQVFVSATHEPYNSQENLLPDVSTEHLNEDAAGDIGELSDEQSDRALSFDVVSSTPITFESPRRLMGYHRPWHLRYREWRDRFVGKSPALVRRPLKHTIFLIELLTPLPSEYIHLQDFRTLLVSEWLLSSDWLADAQMQQRERYPRSA